MDNNMDSMLDMYIFETNTLLEQLDNILISKEKENDLDAESINEIFRIMHTIKGSSAMMQFDSLMTVAHKIEDLFSLVRDTGIDKNYQCALFDLMFKSCDFLKGEMSLIENNLPLTVNIGNLEEEIKDILKKFSIETKEFSEKTVENKIFEAELSIRDEKIMDDNEKEESKDNFATSVVVYFEDNCGMENIRAFMLIKDIGDACSEFSYYPTDLEDKKVADEIAKNGLSIHFTAQKDLDAGIRIIESFLYTKDYSIQKTDMPSENKEDKIKAEENEISNRKTASQPAGKQSLINVNLKKLDALMDLVGEIVITESMVSAIAHTEDEEKDNYEKKTRELRKLTNELQEIVMSVRMVPVAEIFQKMNRIVRDMNKQLDKDVELKLIGENTELDKTIVDNLADPLMHLMRNAMDHGIEPKQERLACGKSEKGHLVLSAKNAGGEILISIQDDGKGLNAQSILQKAKNKGLLQKAENEYSETEIFSFIFLPGFSTNEAVTEFSGRGVGMDVVKYNLEKIGGVVAVDSKLGEGTTFTLKIPLTLAIISGMQLKVGDSEFTLPINNIQQAFKANDTNITHDMDKREIVMIRNEYYSILPLHQIFGVKTDITNTKDGILILVDAGSKRYCIFADGLLGEQQIVVKQLPIYLNRFNVKESGITGCAILGTGNISLILDAAKLYNHISQ